MYMYMYMQILGQTSVCECYMFGMYTSQMKITTLNCPKCAARLAYGTTNSVDNDGIHCMHLKKRSQIFSKPTGEIQNWSCWLGVLFSCRVAITRSTLRMKMRLGSSERTVWLCVQLRRQRAGIKFYFLGINISAHQKCQVWVKPPRVNFHAVKKIITCHLRL